MKSAGNLFKIIAHHLCSRRAMIPLAALLLFGLTGTAQAQSTTVSYQGRVQDNGTNFTGTGLFKFALVTGTNQAYVTYWSNDGTSNEGSEPAAAVSVPVTDGLFTVLLGDTNQARMTGMDAALFLQPNLQLRIWFNDGVSGSAALSPLQNLAAAPYAAFANTASNLNGSLPVSQLSGTVPNSQLANGSVTVTAGTGLSGGGTVPLGGATTLNNAGVLSVTGNADITATTVNGAVSIGHTATDANTPNTLIKRDANGDFCASTITANLAGNADTVTHGVYDNGVYADPPWITALAGDKVTGDIGGKAAGFAGSLEGDVTGTQGATVASSVGGQTAASVASGASAANAATSEATPNTIVRRDATGSFVTTNITVNGTITGNGEGLTNLNAANVSGTLANSQLANGSVTVTAGTGLSGGGVVALGGTTTLNNAGVLSVAGNSDITVSSVSGAVTLGDTATALSTPSTLIKRDASGNFAAGTITANLAGNATSATTAATATTANSATSFSGPLAGDVTGTQSATSVERLRGQTVSAATPTAGQHLRYDGSQWLPGTVALDTDVSGMLADGRLSVNVALRNANQAFMGTNTFSGVAIVTNTANQFAGSFNGNGSGLSNLTPGNLSAGTAAISITGNAATATTATSAATATTATTATYVLGEGLMLTNVVAEASHATNADYALVAGGVASGASLNAADVVTATNSTPSGGTVDFSIRESTTSPAGNIAFTAISNWNPTNYNWAIVHVLAQGADCTVSFGPGWRTSGGPCIVTNGTMKDFLFTSQMNVFTNAQWISAY